MTTLGEHPSARAATPSRTETVGDGMSTAALITAWVGAAFPLLPAVALIVAIAGRKRSLTRWLNNTAIIVSAIFLAAQIAIPLAFGAALAKAAGDYMNRDQQTSVTDLSSDYDELGLDDVGGELPTQGSDVPAVEPSPEASSDPVMSEAATADPDATFDEDTANNYLEEKAYQDLREAADAAGIPMDSLSDTAYVSSDGNIIDTANGDAGEEPDCSADSDLGMAEWTEYCSKSN